MEALLAATQVPAAPVLIVMAAGVAIAIVGHAARSRGLVVTGLALLFLATALVVLFGFRAFQGGETDPRPANSPSRPGY